MPGLGTWIAVGMALIFIGIIIIAVATMYEAASASQQSQQGKVQAGGVIMIGPVPIIFGTSWRMAIIAIVLAIVLIALVMAMMFLFRPVPAPSAPSPAQAVDVLRALIASGP